MLSLSPARVGGGPASAVLKVFTAVVCIHPCQVVMSIKDGANDLISHSTMDPKKSLSTLCRLPRCMAKTFYPSPLNDTFLVLPYAGTKGVAKKVRLDLSVVHNKHMVVRHLHRCPTPEGDEVVLPPLYSKDPGIPGTLPVGYLSPLWTNTEYTAAVPDGGSGLLGVWPAISLVTFCAGEEAKRSLAQLTGEGMVYSPKWCDKSEKPLESLLPGKPSECAT